MGNATRARSRGRRPGQRGHGPAPIGAARDVTLRTLDLLATADVIAAEDTRTARHLMDIHGIALAGRRLVACHDHSGEEVIRRLVDEMAQGRSVLYVSEAGTPLVSDPGFALARAAIARGVAVTAAPGPSALLAALGEVLVASGRGRQALQDQEPGQTKSAPEATLEDCRVDARAIQLRPIDLEVAVRVL